MHTLNYSRNTRTTRQQRCPRLVFNKLASKAVLDTADKVLGKLARGMATQLLDALNSRCYPLRFLAKDATYYFLPFRIHLCGSFQLPIFRVFR